MDASQRFTADGFAIVPEVIDNLLCAEISDRIAAMNLAGAGCRRLLGHPWCVAVAARLRTNPAIRDLLPKRAVAVQCTLFSKTSERNWLVPPHQDLSIPVSQRVDGSECTGWSEKDGDLFVQPPIKVLENLVAIRVHLDPCPVENGALRVTPGSHREGRLDRPSIRRLIARQGEEIVPVPRAGALVMRPLLLHSSSKSALGSPRRVLHFLFGPHALPARLQWKTAV